MSNKVNEFQILNADGPELMRTSQVRNTPTQPNRCRA